MSNPHNCVPSQDDSPTPNIAEYIKSIPSWSPEEQLTLEENMRHYPSSQNAEFKRLTLLMTNLPNKRLRDVSLRVKYMKAKEKGDISWENFLQNSFGQQKVEVSPSHSIKSPRATPTDREEPQKRGKRTPMRPKKDEEDLSMSSNSNQISSVGSSSFARDREPSMSMSSNTPINYHMQPRNPVPPPGPIQQMPQRQFQQPQFQSQLTRPQPVVQRERWISPEDQTCNGLIAENERCLENITQAVMQKRTDFSESIAVFNGNLQKLIQITNQMAASLPMFYFTPISVNLPKFKKEDIRHSPAYGADFVKQEQRRDVL